MFGDDDLRAYVHRNRRRLAEQLAEWVRIPSIAGDPEYADALPRSANYLAGLCRAIGFPRVEVWQHGGTEAVFAEWRADVFAPTVLVYSHHDVRAVTGEPWRQTHPFTPVARDGCLFGRGASDAKGQVIAHLWGLRAHLAAAIGAGEPSAVRAPSVTIRLLVEGEEELGSPHLEALLAEHADDLSCDLVVYSDTTLLDPDRPAVTTSVRGRIGAELTMFGPARDVHSGAVSGPAPNPAADLAALVARLHDADGRVTLPGFYAPVTTPTPEQHEDYAALGVDDGWWLEASGTGRIAGEHGYTVPELLWARPALEVISMTAGDIEDVHRAVIPASATAALDIRLVDGQSPEEVAGQLERWVAAEARGIPYELSISRETAEAPYRTPEHPAVEALADAMRVGFGVETVGRMGNAGGGPAELLASTLDAPLVFFGTGLVSDRWHASDERVRLDVLERGAATLAAFWPRLAEAMATGVRTGTSDMSSASEASDASRSSDTTAASHSSDTTATSHSSDTTAASHSSDTSAAH